MKYEELMKMCIESAKRGEGCVSPNPLVGCIILNNENEIISEGYHEKYGENHAERNALLKLDKDSSKGATLIVNLEPCSHYGKTPPCADLIIEKGISKVVIGMRDVNPVVSGNGIRKLKEAGIEVIEGVLEDECRKLNEIFIKNMTKQQSFVAIKTATTLDGKIATQSGSSKWITSEKAREEVINIRRKYDAILTSSSTVSADNPNMKHKKKIIIDRELKTDFSNANIYKNGTIYVSYNENISSERLESVLRLIKYNNNVNLLPTKVIDDKIDLRDLLEKIYKLGVMSVLVEAGGHLNGSFLEHADKIYQFIAPKILGDNKGLSCFDFRTANLIKEADDFKFEEITNYTPDILVTYTK